MRGTSIRHHQDRLSGAVTIRRLSASAADHRALEELADRDSQRPLAGAVLVAEVEGQLLAAVSLAEGRVVADPFSRTEELRALLELRAAQLGRRTDASRLRLRRWPRERARAALASSPPGAGGRMVELPRWG